MRSEAATSRRRSAARAGARRFVFLALLLGAASPSLAHDITYRIHRTIGQGTVVGTITTDGKTGTLTAADIVSFNLTLNGVGASIVLTNADATAAVDGIDLSAAVQQEPVTLAGIDMPFRFDKGQLAIKRSQIQSFALAGHGKSCPGVKHRHVPFPGRPRAALSARPR